MVMSTGTAIGYHCVPGLVVSPVSLHVMGTAIMPALQGSSVQAHGQLVGILVQLLFPMTGVSSDWRARTVIVKYFNQHSSYGDKIK